MHGESVESLYSDLNKPNDNKSTGSSEEMFLRQGLDFPSELTLGQLIDLGDILHKVKVRPNQNLKGVPGGYTYFGQFIDHDLVFSKDACTSIDNVEECPIQNDNVKYQKSREKGLCLNPVYAGNDNWCKGCGKLNYRTADSLNTCQGVPIDIPRARSNETSLIPDRRNDENWLVSQLHLQFIRLHNKLCNLLDTNLSPEVKFKQAKKSCIQVYQQIIKHDFLQRVLDKEVYEFLIVQEQTLDCLEKWKAPETGDISLQQMFEKAAFRFGHTMVRDKYLIRSGTDSRLATERSIQQLFQFSMNNPDNLSYSTENDVVEWSLLFGENPRLNLANPIFPAVRFKLPHLTWPNNLLATRNLIRGRVNKLPSFNKVYAEIFKSVNNKEAIKSKKMKILGRHFYEEKAFDPSFINIEFLHLNKLERLLDDHPNPEQIINQCPLWLGLLCEAHVHSRDQPKGASILGPVGSLLVGAYLAQWLKGVSKSSSMEYKNAINTMPKLLSFINS